MPLPHGFRLPFLSGIIKEGAYYSQEYQESVGADQTYLKIPTAKTSDNPGGKSFELLKRNMYQGILKDDGYFSAIDPMKRIVVAENTYDLGNRLINKINGLKPERLVTDCLSCRLQFNQLLPYKVYHPIEILKEALKLGS